MSDGSHVEADALADPHTSSLEAELQALGYRSGPALFFGRYGYGPVPDEFETIPDESDEAAGQRLANWAIVRSGQPPWEGK